MNSKALQKALAVLAAVAALSTPVGISLYNDTPQPPLIIQEEAKIIGSHLGEVGELIRLQGVGTEVRWSVIPEVSDTQAFGEGSTNLVLSFRKEGTYTVVAALQDESGLSIHKHEIQIGSKGPVTVVTPDKPVTPETPQVTRPDIASQIAAIAASTALPSDAAQALAKNFDLVAKEIESGRVVTVDGVVARTTDLNRTIDLSQHGAFMEGVQGLLIKEAEAGNLGGVYEHATVWKSIAAGLRTYEGISQSQFSVKTVRANYIW